MLTANCELEQFVSFTVNGMSISQFFCLVIASEGFIIYCYIMPIYCKCQVVCSY